MKKQQIWRKQQRTLLDYAIPSLTGTEFTRVRPNVETNNFELNPSVIQIVIFHAIILYKLSMIFFSYEHLFYV